MSNTRAHRLIPAVWVLLTNKDDEYFLLRRANTGWQDGTFTIPAGHIEYMESPRKAAVRELNEEIGITASEDDLVFSHVMFSRSTDGTDTERVSVFFTLSKYQGSPYLAEPEKASEAGWYHKDSLPVLAAVLPIVMEHIDNDQLYSELYY
jgi:8-oxo-dGTP diphosphatase